MSHATNVTPADYESTRETNMRRSSNLLLAALLAVSLPGAAAAQGLVQITPKIGGWYQSESVQEIDDGAREVQRTGSTNLALGANVEIGLPGSPVGIRGDLSLGTNATVTRSTIEGDEEMEATVLALAGDAVFRPLSFLPFVDPYALIGAGFTSTSFEDEDAQQLFGIDDLPDDREFALHAGVGTDVSLGGIRLQVEATDYIVGLTSDSETGHDVFFTAGLGFDLF